MRWTGVGQSPQFGVPLAKSSPTPVEESLYYWYPQRFGVKLAPEPFRSQLHAISPELEVTWHPIKERWLMWYKRPRIQDHKCPGWLLLFVVEDCNEDYVPLDGRVLAAVYQVSARVFGSAREYFDRLVAEEERSKRSVRSQRANDKNAMWEDRFRYSRIKVGYGPSSGSKFVRYHA